MCFFSKDGGDCDAVNIDDDGDDDDDGDGDGDGEDGNGLGKCSSPPSSLVRL